MARYINAERLKDSMFAYYDCLEESANGRPYKGDTLMDYEVVDMIEDCIDNAPTADVVEVVRCKDCKYFKQHKCIKLNGMVSLNADNFCSYGEKKNEQNDTE